MVGEGSEAQICSIQDERKLNNSTSGLVKFDPTIMELHQSGIYIDR